MKTFNPIQLTTLILIAMQLTACGVEIRDKNETPPEVHAKVLPAGMIPMSGQNFVIEEGAQPLEYRVRLQMPEGATYIIRTAHKGLASERYWADKAEYIDAKVESGESYEYSFHRNPTEVLLSTTVHVPKDFFIQGVVALKDLNTSQPVRRLFMSAKAVIQTGSENFEFRVESLLADPGARIETFAEDSVAAVGSAGASGGLGRLVIMKAIGQLQVELRGQKGGTGTPAPAHAGRAADGQSFGPTVRNRANCGGVAVGGAGAQGAIGSVGGNGQQGGSTGSLEIELQDDSEFKVTSNFTPGRAGDPGQGGPGQQGGFGGTGETRTVYMKMPKGPDMMGGIETYSCGNPTNGANGATGPQGPAGQPGTEGSKGFFCLKVSNSCRL